jgi:hypothetical protein
MYYTGLPYVSNSSYFLYYYAGVAGVKLSSGLRTDIVMNTPYIRVAGFKTQLAYVPARIADDGDDRLLSLFDCYKSYRYFINKHEPAAAVWDVTERAHTHGHK